MNQKENALRIIRCDHPERIVSDLPCHAMDYFGCNHESYDGGGHQLPVGSIWKDIWNTEWHKEHANVMGFPRGNPLCDMENLAGYIWPDPNDEKICGRIYSSAKGYRKEEEFLFGSHRDTLWEKAYMLVGMENMMMYFYTEPEYAREILHRIMDFQLGIAAHYLSLGVEIVGMTDDLGTQDSLILNPDVINAFLLPEYKRLFKLYKDANVLVFFHSCGHIEPLLEMFISLGVDVLDPVQATANNLEHVRNVTRSRMALHGGVSSGIIMEGPIERIREEVKKAMLLLGTGGGYFCSPDQWMPYPEQHIQAFYKAVEELGGSLHHAC